MRLDPLIFASVLLCGACGAAEVSGGVAVTAPGAPIYGAPKLANLAPGVEVVTDWTTPVFFADDFFWHWDGGTWYRSATLRGPRVEVAQLPVAVARLRAPWAYARYRVPDRVVQRPIPYRAHDERMGSYHATRRR